MRRAFKPKEIDDERVVMRGLPRWPWRWRGGAAPGGRDRRRESQPTARSAYDAAAQWRGLRTRLSSRSMWPAVRAAEGRQRGALWPRRVPARRHHDAAQRRCGLLRRRAERWLRNNHTEAQIAAFKAQIDALNANLKAWRAKRAMHPLRVRARCRHARAGQCQPWQRDPREDFFTAVLRVWIGDKRSTPISRRDGRRLTHRHTTLHGVSRPTRSDAMTETLLPVLQKHPFVAESRGAQERLAESRGSAFRRRPHHLPRGETTRPSTC